MKVISQQSPIQQYRSLKISLPRGMILFMLLGEHYETYGEDAYVSSPILGSYLRLRGTNPMCGFNRLGVDTALAKFVRTGKSVALAERCADGVFRVTRVVN